MFALKKIIAQQVAGKTLKDLESLTTGELLKQADSVVAVLSIL